MLMPASRVASPLCSRLPAPLPLLTLLLPDAARSIPRRYRSAYARAASSAVAFPAPPPPGPAAFSSTPMLGAHAAAGTPDGHVPTPPLPVAPVPKTAARTPPLVVGVRREDKNRWERRVPVTPDHVERLVLELGASVLVQPSTRRVFPDDKYRAAGATVQEDLSAADIILGVKEVPADLLLPDKTYLFFSHTYKGQPYNMSLLRSVLDKRVRLIDYELMRSPENGARLVLFSRFAGYA
ncbi:hypothetical protein HK405_000693, partial [Cladochytrium tenue]